MDTPALMICGFHLNTVNKQRLYAFFLPIYRCLTQANSMVKSILFFLDTINKRFLCMLNKMKSTVIPM